MVEFVKYERKKVLFTVPADLETNGGQRPDLLHSDVKYLENKHMKYIWSDWDAGEGWSSSSSTSDDVKEMKLFDSHDIHVNPSKNIFQGSVSQGTNNVSPLPLDITQPIFQPLTCIHHYLVVMEVKSETCPTSKPTLSLWVVAVTGISPPTIFAV